MKYTLRVRFNEVQLDQEHHFEANDTHELLRAIGQAINDSVNSLSGLQRMMAKPYLYDKPFHEMAELLIAGKLTNPIGCYEGFVEAALHDLKVKKILREGWD